VFEPGAFTPAGRLARWQVHEILQRGLSVFPVLDALAVDDQQEREQAIEGVSDGLRSDVRAHRAALSSVLDALACRLSGDPNALPADAEERVRSTGERLLASIDAFSGSLAESSDLSLRSKLAGYRALCVEGGRGVLDLLACGRAIPDPRWGLGTVVAQGDSEGSEASVGGGA